jgi:hypothetical protein
MIEGCRLPIIQGIKSFQSKDRDLAALERQARFLALLKNVSAILQNSPGSDRAVSAYKHAFRQINTLVGNMLSDVEHEYLSEVQDWEALESICWFLALLIQEKLKHKPGAGSDEEKQIKILEQRLLTLMLRTELEVTDTMKLIWAKKILSFIKNTADYEGRNHDGNPILESHGTGCWTEAVAFGGGEAESTKIAPK